MFKYLGIPFIFLLAITSCQTEKPLVLPTTDLGGSAIIPKPIKVLATHSAFVLDSSTVILTDQRSKGFEQLGDYLSQELSNSWGLNQSKESKNKPLTQRMIYIGMAENEEFDSPESYSLYIKKDSILIQAPHASGAFRGIQTLLQVIPRISNDTVTGKTAWMVPTGKITDKPRYSYRGAMLDVARHFFDVDEVKRFIDQLAFYKYNKLHLHLTDDQGWRLQFKSWPKLTQIGAQFEVGGGKGGYYTQEDFKEIVDYAKNRHIEIVPEIDMPGHTNAANFSYPVLNGNGKQPEYYTGTKVGFSTFDTRKDTVYAFLDNIIGELAKISPSPYIHIGGDESHVTKMKDYRYFVEKVEKIVHAHGKSMMGWDEVAQTNISPSSVVQFWRHDKNAMEAQKKGCKVLFSPADKTYLDMKYEKDSPLGLDWAGLTTLEESYSWNPSEMVKNLDDDSILGVEAPLWSESISNSQELEYLAFPRAIALAEVGWTDQSLRDWNDFAIRIGQHGSLLKSKNINFYHSPSVDWNPKKKEGTGSEVEMDHSPEP